MLRFFLVLLKFVNILLSHTEVKTAVPDSPGAIPGSRTLRLVWPFFSVQFVLHSILKVIKLEFVYHLYFIYIP